MIDHVYISVSDIKRSSSLYEAVLKPLGWRGLGGYEAPAGSDVPNLHGFADKNYGGGVKVGSSVWLRESEAGRGIYLGLAAAGQAEVDAAHKAAVAAGGTDAGAPGIREHFGPGYYAANILDFDGNMLEIVHKSWNPQL
ncbi:MAG: VOC family protein [Segniliparus sp.]|uniref:VOC family protein n=1 Tax=Segniliparus sp. TaxID=2804064 RepID=UPI003F40B953